MYSAQTICSIVNGTFITQTGNDEIEHLVYDSRNILQAYTSVFFALKTSHNDGHKYLADAYQKGVRNFIISDQADIQKMTGATIIQVQDTLHALQALAAYHRRRFQIPVLGITGSNGKTIIKEWLYQLLQDDLKIVRSPKSFNSQIGVPLSVWHMNESYELAIFEAGISTVGEMDRLKNILAPTIGLFTNLGQAHSAGFASQQQKLEEKIKLFEKTDIVIGTYELLQQAGLENKSFSWGHSPKVNLQITSIKKEKGSTIIKAICQNREMEIAIPFTDNASIENAINCWCTLVYLKGPDAKIEERFLKLHAVDMRLQLEQGINNCLIINDSYSADITSLKIALDFLKQQSSGRKQTVILSDFSETGRTKAAVYAEITSLLKTYKITKVITVGAEMESVLSKHLENVPVQSYPSTDDLVAGFKGSSFFNEIILIKGARKYEFERIAQLFEKKQHQTVLEINLNALAHNLKEYQKIIRPDTKIMAMVKAFAYGSGGVEIAGVLQYHNVQYLGVAYADEGVELVKSGIRLPIMVMNADISSFQAMITYNLQPVIYSLHLMQQFENYLQEQGITSYPVHIEIETGMNRLGFPLSDVEALAKGITRSPLVIQSVFTHLAASEDPEQDAYTNLQAQIFHEAIKELEKQIAYPFLKHISNSAAIVRHPQLQMDMVRLGIGLYGIATGHSVDVHPVATLRSTIAQLRHVEKGTSVSYNRRGVVTRDSVIATIRIGYADGYSRRFSNGVGKMWLKGKLAPVIGAVCMDMTMIDVTDIPEVKEGDEVIVFGEELSLQELASWINTIPYELMTSVSERVKRIYFHE